MDEFRKQCERELKKFTDEIILEKSKHSDLAFPCFNLAKEELDLALKQWLPKFKIPVQFYRWPDPEKGNGIKVERSQFQRLARDESSTLSVIS